MAAHEADLWENPIGTDGFEFVEFVAPEPAALDGAFRRLGFTPVARHRSKDVTLYRQGEVNFILNAERQGPAAAFAAQHGPGVNAIAFRVHDAAAAQRRLIAAGARGVDGPIGPMELRLPAIEGIGGCLLYLVDRYGECSIYDVDFRPLDDVDPWPRGVGFIRIDHLTHNVRRGNMAKWAGFYERLFNFREVRYFDIEGKLTGLRSRAMTSPCGRIRIPINESADDKSQIEEFLREYRGEGVQHIALATDDIVATVAALEANGLAFLDVPDTYYEQLDQRLPGHGLDLAPLRAHNILVDGAPAAGGGLLLQIFTQTLVGPIFFEVIERRGNEGFGEGNFKALFESMELDQIRRGVLKA